jgi:hypothetical protein
MQIAEKPPDAHERLRVPSRLLDESSVKTIAQTDSGVRNSENNAVHKVVDDVVCYYEEPKTLEGLVSANPAKFDGGVHKKLSIYAVPQHTGEKNNPYSFAKTYIRTAFDIVKGMRDPNVLQIYSSIEVYRLLENAYVKSRRANTAMLPLPVKILSVHGYRVDKKTSEMSATVLDSGEVKICVIRAEYSHDKWKVAHYGVVRTKNRRNN